MSSIFSVQKVHTDDAQAKKLALEIIATLSDDIATLVIQKNHNSDPQTIKSSCINLITHLADVLATLIIKLKERKETRGIDLCDEIEYQQMLQVAAQNLLSKIQ